jgi:hypothetical protein
VPQQRIIRQIAGGDLERNHVQFREKVDALEIKRRRKKRDPLIVAIHLQFTEITERELEAFDHLELRLLLAGCRLLIFSFGSVGSDDFGGDERLKLNGVGAGRDSRVNELKSEVKLAVVIDTRFRNYERRIPCTNDTLTKS